MRSHDERGSLGFDLNCSKIEASATWPPMLMVWAHVTEVNVRQLVAKSAVTTWLIQFRVNAYPHLPSTSTTVERGEASIGRR